ncbi:MAG: transcriptional repressor [Bacteroidetes bacterium RIFCSPLOWO2_02_FULL_36_8]|nr:MAG: transcriptional repressor [Bacteroidetes bacterium RIFCSPLOWO2_02_FULL_36_8]OFY70724.1 MAG: transcriptional repressor [Bacteroidetes bacterium RIFCSPLOWO2_12_FULL_37_12]
MKKNFLMFQEVRKIFSDYLEKKSLRKTQERFNILKIIYEREDHFDAEDLYIWIKNNNYNISRATVYNTLELLNDCELVTKHQFGGNLSKYEKCYGYRQHDHVICIECRNVVEFCDPRIYQIQKKVEELLNFTIHHHSLNLYGLCPNCKKLKN